MGDIEGSKPNWYMQSMRPAPDGSAGKMSNLKSDCGGIHQTAATAGAGLGCKHFPPQRSDCYMPRRLKKEVHQTFDTTVKPEGTRKVPQKTYKGPGQGAHFKGDEMTRIGKLGYCGTTGSVNDMGSLIGGPETHYANRTAQTWERHHIQTKARVYDTDGERMVEKPAREFVLEGKLQRKKRVDLSLTGQQTTQGGKCYSDPSYSAKYWAQEGLNPCGRMLVREQPVHSTHTLEMDEATLNWKAPRRATFAEKQQQNAQRDDVNEVSMLPKTRRQNAAAKYSSLLASANAKAAEP